MSLESRDQLCHFVTMCIFTCTGQHSSVHLGQVLVIGGQWTIVPGVGGWGMGCVLLTKEFLCLADFDSRYLPLLSWIGMLGSLMHPAQCGCPHRTPRM